MVLQRHIGVRLLSTAICVTMSGPAQASASFKHNIPFDFSGSFNLSKENPSKEDTEEEERSAKSSETEELDQVVEKLFNESIREKLEALPEKDAHAVKKAALQLKIKNESKSKNWRDELSDEAKLNEEELKKALEFAKAEYEKDAENYDLRQLNELLEENLEQLQKKKTADADQKAKADEALSALSSWGKDMAEKFNQLKGEVSKAWDGLSETEKKGTEVGARLAADTLLPGAGALIPSLTSSKPSSTNVSSAPATKSNPPADKPAASPPSSPSSSGSNGTTHSSSASSVPSTRPESSSSNSGSNSGSSSASNSAVSSETGASNASTPTPANNGTSTNTASDTKPTALASASPSSPSAPNGSTATASPTQESKPLDNASNVATKPSGSAPGATASTGSGQNVASTPTKTAQSKQALSPIANSGQSRGTNNANWQPNSIPDILEKQKQVIPTGVSTLGSTVDRRHSPGSPGGNGPIASGGGDSVASAQDLKSDGRSNSGADQKVWSSAIDSSPADVFARGKTDLSGDSNYSNRKGTERASAAAGTLQNPTQNPGQNATGTPTSASSPSDDSSGVANDDSGTPSAFGATSGSAGFNLANSNTYRSSRLDYADAARDWNSLSASGVTPNSMPGLTGPRLEMQDNAVGDYALTPNNSSRGAVARVQAVLDSNDAASESAMDGMDSRYEEYLAGRGLGDFPGAKSVSALANPARSDRGAGAQDEHSANIDENSIPLSAGYNVTPDIINDAQDVLQLLRMKAKGVKKDAGRTTQVAYLAKSSSNGTEKRRDLSSWYQEMKGPKGPAN